MFMASFVHSFQYHSHGELSSLKALSVAEPAETKYKRLKVEVDIAVRSATI
jgi:hypothetical protein